MWFTKSQIRKCERAHLAAPRTPLPSRMVSNGEYMPVLQTPEQKQVLSLIQVVLAFMPK